MLAPTKSKLSSDGTSLQLRLFPQALPQPSFCSSNLSDTFFDVTVGHIEDIIMGKYAQQTRGLVSLVHVQARAVLSVKTTEIAWEAGIYRLHGLQRNAGFFLR